jgi:cytoskeletal protein CcmA (bactofilin family)
MTIPGHHDMVKMIPRRIMGDCGKLSAQHALTTDAHQGRLTEMLSNFTTKKPDKEIAPVNLAAATQTMAPPALPPAAQPMMQPRAVSNVAPRLGDRVQPSVIGPDLTILGNLVSKGEVQVDGEVQGDLHGSHIVVGEKAKITGSIVAEEVVVRGHVMGSIRGKKVMLQASSHVDGDIYHQTLSIETGAFFEGKSRRSEDPTAGVTRPEVSGGAGSLLLPVPANS